MQVILKDVAKRFIRDWIIKDFSHIFENHSQTAIVGPNGSGKSTLLKIISGILPPTSGTIEYGQQSNQIALEDSYRHISFCAPYQELIEEYTLSEILNFHGRFRSLPEGESVPLLAEKLQLGHALHKQIRFFSSGMKQRVRVGLAMLTKADLTLLDEPTSNLDKEGLSWYLSFIEEVKGDRTVIIASNHESEYQFCTSEVRLSLQ